MVVAVRYAVGIAAVFFLALSFEDAAHSQNALPMKTLKISESEAGSEGARVVADRMRNSSQRLDESRLRGRPILSAD